MRVPGIGNIRNLTSEKARNTIIKKLKAVNIRRSKRVIKAEYMDYCESGEKSEANKIGFLSIMKLLANPEAMIWIKAERVHQIKKRINKSGETPETKKELIAELLRQEGVVDG